MRFPEFVFPWQVKTIKEICTCKDNERKPLNENERSEMIGDIPYYGANNIQGYINKYLFNEDLILLAEDGGHFDDFNNYPIAQLICGKTWVNNHAHVLKPRFDDIGFLFQQLIHKDIRKYINGTSRAKLNQEDLMKIPLGISSLEEEKKISIFLALLDKRIDTQNKIIEETRSLKKAIYFNSVKAAVLKEVMVSDICEIGRGRVISQQEIAKQESPKYPVFSSQTLNNGIMGYLDNYDFDGEYVTWTTDGANAGTVFYHDEKFNCTNVCGTLKVKDNAILPYYLYIALSHVAKKYVSKNLGNPKLMNGVMGKITIKIPDALNQGKVVNCLKAIDELIENEVKLLECYKNQKRYLLNNMFI